MSTFHALLSVLSFHPQGLKLSRPIALQNRGFLPKSAWSLRAGAPVSGRKRLVLSACVTLQSFVDVFRFDIKLNLRG
jgi:hypothetical protein